MRTWVILPLLCAVLPAADPLMQPVTVCEIVKDPVAYEGKVVPLVGRFSFRSSGRFVSEEACEEGPAAAARAGVLPIAEDGKSAPQVPLILKIDAKAVAQKLEHIRRTTSLRKFRFGSPDYDRWALVYGQVERRDPPPPAAAPESGAAPPVRLLIRGDGAIIFLSEN